MIIAIFKNDYLRIPYLVHFIDKDSNIAVLGLLDYPDIQQDYGTSLDLLDILDESSEEYIIAKERIEKYINQ